MVVDRTLLVLGGSLWRAVLEARGLCGEYDDANVREHPCRHEVAVQERRSPEWYIQKKPSNLKDS